MFFPLSPAKFAMSPDTGDPIDNNLAWSATFVMTLLLVIEEVKTKYLPLNNCELTDTPRGNTPSWDNLPTPSGSRDLKLQRAQKSLTRELNACL